jgi:transposase-like protein
MSAEIKTELARGTEFTTVENYDPRVKAQAFNSFLTTDLSLSDIALDLGVSSKVVASWSRKGGWLERKKEIETELFKSAEDQYRRLIVEHRVPTMLRHLRVSGKLEEGIEKVIDEETKDDRTPNDMKLKRMAEALSSSATVSARAAGISEKPFSDHESEKQGKVPLIAINVVARPAATELGTPVTIEAEEVTDD